MKRTDITALFPDATDEQVKAIMTINGADVNKAKGDLDTVREQLTKTQAEFDALRKAAPKDALKEATERADALQARLDAMQKADSIRQIREKVAGETNVPAALLTGETEDACAEQAKAIVDFAKPSGYPSLKDGGETQKQGGAATRDQFAAWANENL